DWVEDYYCYALFLFYMADYFNSELIQLMSVSFYKFSNIKK
ncbi:hypothetical protein ECH7EC508_5596, partial [Escherichia coli O157:H7 str. EC508]